MDTDSESEISSGATEPSTFSSPEPVKIKHAKRKKVKKLKHRKQKSKHAYESSDEESDVPKKKRKIKKLRKHPKHVKQSEERESKVPSKKRKPTSSEDYAKELKVDDIDIGAIRTVTGGGRVNVDTKEWMKLMEYVQ